MLLTSRRCVDETFKLERHFILTELEIFSRTHTMLFIEVVLKGMQLSGSDYHSPFLGRQDKIGQGRTR